MQKEVTLRVEESIYKQFMGFIRLNKKVEVVSTPLPTVKLSGRRVRSHLPVVKAFIYDFDEGGARLLMFCRGLMALGWIDQNTNIQTFIDLFSGGEIRQRIIWTGDTNILAELFRRLVNERGLVKLPAKMGLWVMVNGHFWEKERLNEFGIARLRKTHCPLKHDQTIAYLVKILDPDCSVDDICKLMESQR